MSADLISVATIGLDARSAGSEAVYTYLASPGMKVGDAYFVPLGPRRAIGFVLELAEVAPEWLHPVLGKTAAQLAAALGDFESVHRW